MNEPEKKITESEVVAWLKRERDAAGIPGLMLKIDSDDNCIIGNVLANEPYSYGFAVGHTIAEAIEKLRPQLKKPEEIIREKRTAALKLENEAALLELEMLNAQTATLNLSSTQ